MQREELVQNPVSKRRFDAVASHPIPFAGLVLFTILLYLRPNEMFPEVFGTFPLVKIVAIVTLIAYALSKIAKGERLTVWTLELTMLSIIVGLAIIFVPIAEAPQDSINALTEVFLKVVAIFLLMINLINTPNRLRLIMKVVVICGGIIAALTVRAYSLGQFDPKGIRLVGVVGGIFGNPNDIATSLNLLLPLAVALAFTAHGVKRALYIGCATVITAGIVVTFSRGGFLGLVALAAVLVWKLSRKNRPLAASALVLVVVVFMAAAPGGYGVRIISIFVPELDATGSRETRRNLLERATVVAANHLVVGVGIGNYHIYSNQEQRAHNSYLEISAELGVAGLVAYLILMFAPLRSLRRIERDLLDKRPSANGVAFAPPARAVDDPIDEKREGYYLSVALQASLAAYLVCSFFASIQYLWYLYYILGYAISFRLIQENSQQVSEPQIVPVTVESTGTLWNRQGSVNRQPALVRRR
jgi:O-antigen ligase